MLRWLRRLLRDRETSEMIRARFEHLRIMRKAARELPDDEVIREAVRRAERAMRGEAG